MSGGWGWLYRRLVPDDALRLRSGLRDRLSALRWSYMAAELSVGRSLMPAVLAFEAAVRSGWGSNG